MLFRSPINTTIGKKLFAELAQEMLDKEQPAIYNQAIMDFGATQCIPQQPNCELCPLINSCMGYAKRLVKTLPIKEGKTKSANRYLNYFLVRMGDDVFLHKRTENDIWKNLYELPLIETSEYCNVEDLLASQAFVTLFDNVEILSVHLVKDRVKHVLSHRILYANFYEIDIAKTTNVLLGNKQIHISEIEQYATPKLIHSFLEKYM